MIMLKREGFYLLPSRKEHKLSTRKRKLLFPGHKAQPPLHVAAACSIQSSYRLQYLTISQV